MENVLVTGGAGGIGSAIAELLYKKGYNITILDNSEESINEMKRKFKDMTFYNVDVTNIEQVKKCYTQIAKEKVIDHIVCLAGRALKDEWKRFEDQDIYEIHKSIELNLLGHINVIHSFLPLLKKSKNNKTVTLISSINAFSDFGLPAYSASKSGMYGLVKCLCSEFGQDNIRINSVSPGTIVTPATEKEPKDFDQLLKSTAIGHFATKEEVAEMVNFIINNNGITGQNFVIDAGQSVVLKK